jgi:hypothetical protein
LLRTDFKPLRYKGDRGPLSPQTLRKIYITLSSFFTWAATEFDFESPMKVVLALKY